MNLSRLIMGLYDSPAAACPAPTRARLRDLSLSWARFGYQGRVIEGDCARSVLDEAAVLGYDYCLLVATGTLFDENWYPAHWKRRDAHSAFLALMNEGRFLAAGRVIEQAEGGVAVDGRCLLVNLERYGLCGNPELAGARLASTKSSDQPDGQPSWSLAETTGAAGALFRPFDHATASAIVDLVSPSGDVDSTAPLLGRGIEIFGPDELSIAPILTPEQRRLLSKVRRQVDGAKRGVFPWNLESYGDVDLPPDDLTSPLSAVYGVAAGFKPYRILKTHGFGPTTRVVLFDYSARALEFRQRQISEWDGSDYPSFLRRMFRELPSDTFFQLWAGLTPDRVADDDLDHLWKSEIDRWGDEDTFQTHWNRCRALPHEFILCDLLESPQALFDRIDPESDAVIWWSNAFFTIYSNWFMTIAERRHRYVTFIRGLAAHGPDLFLYGADHMNSSVNSIRADEYAARLTLDADKVGSALVPDQYHRLQIRS